MRILQHFQNSSKTSFCLHSTKNYSLNRMFRDFANELEQLNNSCVHIKYKDNVNKVIQDIIAGGTRKLQIVSDFDKTITKHHENGISQLTSFDIFAKCKSLPDDYVAKQAALKREFAPSEIDTAISISEKKALMEKWWDRAAELLVGLKVPTSDIKEVVANSGSSLRDGTEKAFETLKKANVPVIVFSAGLGDAVVAVLEHFNILSSNVKVVSNILDRDENNVIKGFKDKTINMFNKNQIALQGTEVYDLVRDRENIIVMGDSIGDEGMADGVPHSKAVLKIGFLYYQPEENLDAYMEKFDIVLRDDQTMNVLNYILSLMN